MAAIAHLASTEIGINVLMPPHFATRNGNCLFESVVLIRNPNLSDEDRIALTRYLRSVSVREAIRQVDLLTEERWERLLNVTTNKHATPRTREEMKQLLTKYLKDGMYEDEGGDLLPYILSASLNRPLIIVDVLRDQTTTTTIFPDQIFYPEEGQMGEPLLLVRRGEHYDPLIVVNGGEARVLAFFNQELKRQVPSLDAVATTTTPSDPPSSNATTTTTTTAPTSMRAGPSTTNVERDRQQVSSVERAAHNLTSGTTTTTTEQHGQDMMLLSTILQDCVLQEDTGDEDDDAQILLTTSSNEQGRAPIEHPPVLPAAPPVPPDDDLPTAPLHEASAAQDDSFSPAPSVGVPAAPDNIVPVAIRPSGFGWSLAEADFR